MHDFFVGAWQFYGLLLIHTTQYHSLSIEVKISEDKYLPIFDNLPLKRIDSNT